MSTERTRHGTRTGDPWSTPSTCTKSFHGTEVLKGIDLDVRPGEVVCLLGPSGSGKTTFLRCINQLETIDGGRIWVDGDLMGYADRAARCTASPTSEIAAQRREIGMVFQRFNLFPHMTALENIMEAPIQVKGEKKKAVPRARPAPCSTGSGCGQARRLPRPALRRSAAAGRHRAGPGHAAQAHALRRAHLGARPRARRRGARRDARARPRRHDDDRGHPRDGLRPRGRRPGRVHGRRRRRRAGTRPARSSPTRSTSAPAASCGGCGRRSRPTRRPRTGRGPDLPDTEGSA